MKKLFPLFTILLLGCGFKTVASHFIGAEMSYQKMSASDYEVTVRFYEDCNQLIAPSAVLVLVNAPNCGVGKGIYLNLHSQKISNPFGPAVPVSCSPSSPVPLYKISTYKGTLTFSPADFACPDWILSWNDCCRNNMENITTTGGTSLYTEARLKLQANLTNHSPVFDTLNAPLIYVNHQKDYALSMAATDLDGDSLVYRLMPALSNFNTPITYKPVPPISAYTSPFPGNMAFLINPNPKAPFVNPFNPQLAQLTGGPATLTTYLPEFPMISVRTDWNGPGLIPMPGAPNGMIWSANYFFNLNPLNGALKFNTTYFNTSSQPGSGGNNQYVVSVMVEEYRKINGVFTKIGSVRRETMIKVFSSSQNLNPVVMSPVANSQPLAAGSEIRLRPGTPLTLQFSATDDDTTDVVYLSSNATTILPGAIFTATSGNTATGTISWMPTAAHVRQQPYYFQILARDNGNPLRGVYTETIAVRVSNIGGVTGTPQTLPQAQEFTAFPNPFSAELNFRLNLNTKAESILIYNLLGQLVDEIPLKTVGLGAQKVQWKNATQHAAGTYVARLIAADKTVQTIKFTKLQ